MKETDLEVLRKISQLFLYQTPVRDERITAIIHHPYFNEFGIETISIKNGLQVAEYMKNEEQLEIAKKKYEDIFSKQDETLSFFMLLNKPYLLTYFKYVNEALSEKDFAEMLHYAYQREEMPSKNVNVSIEEITEWFTQANPEFLMEDEEKEIYNNLPDVVEVYRGVRDEETKVKSLSWTTDINVAKKFQKMYEPNVNGRLFKATVLKEDTFAYWRGESELLLKPNKLKGMTEIK